MATITKWNAGAVTTMLSTELNTLASGSISAPGSTVFDNSATGSPGLFLFADFQLDLTLAIAPTVNLPVLMFLIPSLDGTNFGFGSSGNAWQGYQRGGWSMIATTSEQILVCQGIPIPPQKFKLQVQNQSGQTFPASGTTVKMMPYNYQNA